MAEEVSDKEYRQLVDKCIEDDVQQPKMNYSESVSIRCRRHKKRFDVPREWIKTCAWLCPRCYNKLTETERQRYAPPMGMVVDVRPAGGVKEEDSNLILPKESPIPDKEFHKKNNERHKHQAAIPPKAPMPKVNKTDFLDSSDFSPSLATLMPKQSIECKKCRQIKPVHREWLENKSKVLCPECFFGMSATERMMFHKKHPATKAKVNTIIRANETTKPREYRIDLGSDVSAIVRGGRLSNDRIMHMKKSELIQAVREGKVSRPRARIELNRRRKAHYYSDLPDIERATPAL